MVTSFYLVYYTYIRKNTKGEIDMKKNNVKEVVGVVLVAVVAVVLYMCYSHNMIHLNL